SILFLFLAAAQFMLVGSSFDHALVGDADGDEQYSLIGYRQRCVHDHAEQAEFGRQELAGAAAPSFQKDFYRSAVAEQTPHVGVDHRGVKLVALKCASNEECTPTAQDRTDGHEVQVV